MSGDARAWVAARLDEMIKKRFRTRLRIWFWSRKLARSTSTESERDMDRTSTNRSPPFGASDVHPVDAGIEAIVRVLWSNGVETFESCEGGPGHSFLEPTVRFPGPPTRSSSRPSTSLLGDRERGATRTPLGDDVRVAAYLFC
jgi:hypothetical protein